MLLHTLNVSPASAAFTDCLRLLARGDCLVLTGDGVYAMLPDTAGLRALLASGAELYVLENDARAAGIRSAPEGVRFIDMDGFVALTERCLRQLAWY